MTVNASTQMVLCWRFVATVLEHRRLSHKESAASATRYRVACHPDARPRPHSERGKVMYAPPCQGAPGRHSPDSLVLIPPQVFRVRLPVRGASAQISAPKAFH
ncbi:hypothetical protein E2C01_072110 [Portunus trituberculatus]|uniref:Uncharacterized protein n=1 Tax=Portunus trituberculatus TaxID=210409 RepID=A0A5B7HX58_PORTR|nr:hypothetical protein [Portunus trituberculatus]